MPLGKPCEPSSSTPTSGSWGGRHVQEVPQVGREGALSGLPYSVLLSSVGVLGCGEGAPQRAASMAVPRL